MVGLSPTACRQKKRRLPQRAQVGKKTPRLPPSPRQTQHAALPHSAPPQPQSARALHVTQKVAVTRPSDAKTRQTPPRYTPQPRRRPAPTPRHRLTPPMPRSPVTRAGVLTGPRKKTNPTPRPLPQNAPILAHPKSDGTYNSVGLFVNLPNKNDKFARLKHVKPPHRRHTQHRVQLGLQVVTGTPSPPLLQNGVRVLNAQHQKMTRRVRPI